MLLMIPRQVNEHGNTKGSKGKEGTDEEPIKVFVIVQSNRTAVKVKKKMKNECQSLMFEIQAGKTIQE